MKTLGLSPHLNFSKLNTLSEKQVENVPKEMSELDNAKFYSMEASSPSCPIDYNDLDRRSRFRIISTSPSLDTRIQCNSCVQIQHVNSEMYLSYDSRT